jgi:H+/Cl- antiporter ClcA
MMESICHLAQVLIASVTATFVCHIFLGEDPALVIPSIGHLSGILYVLVIPTAGLAALAGAAFQKGTLILRDRIKRIFSPTLFFGAAIGLAFIDVCGLALHLQVNDRIALTV